MQRMETGAGWSPCEVCRKAPFCEEKTDTGRACKTFERPWAGGRCDRHEGITPVPSAHLPPQANQGSLILTAKKTDSVGPQCEEGQRLSKLPPSGPEVTPEFKSRAEDVRMSRWPHCTSVCQSRVRRVKCLPRRRLRPGEHTLLLPVCDPRGNSRFFIVSEG